MKICGYNLDQQQQQIVNSDDKHILVVAGAGSGKTLTILGKIKYLLDKDIKPDEILCISFTKKAADSLKEKISNEFNIKIPVYTFHKLSLEILDTTYLISDTNLLSDIAHKFIYEDVLESKYFMKIILKYFKHKYKSKNKYLNYVLNNDNIKILERLIVTFIHLFKCNNYNIKSFNSFLKQTSIFNYNHERIFLILVLNIYIKYERYLKENNEIDFDDMIIYATKKVLNESLNINYKYIIIDEYQDTSYVRFLLIKAILDKTDASLMVVGDDFQSIYRFTGCDINLFLNFKYYFKNANIMKIENTYRNSNELIKIAGSFVMKNKRQIKKELSSKKHLNNPIQIIYYKNIKESFKKLILSMYNEGKCPIMILGRNNNDINMIIDNDYKIDDNRIIYKQNKDIIMYYLTVHKSKGLEEENVIIINLEDKLLGFPSKIKDDKLLRFVTKDYDKYKYAEERRLFYVALTRTKNYVYLLVPYKNKSVFIREIKKYTL